MLAVGILHSVHAVNWLLPYRQAIALGFIGNIFLASINTKYTIKKTAL
jgi:hypothetical protein